MTGRYTSGAESPPRTCLVDKEVDEMGRPVVHFEIGSKDAGRSRRFYDELFDWDIELDQQGYGSVKPQDGAGIGGGIMTAPPGVPPYVTIYVDVDDLEKALERAETLGGHRVTPPMPIPGVGSFAMMADPDGNVIGLMKEVEV
jgi:predicted enzyme related to lactoylglutathione lyase